LHQKFRFGRSAKKNASAFEFFKRKTPQHLNFSKKNASAFEIFKRKTPQHLKFEIFIYTNVMQMQMYIYLVSFIAFLPRRIQKILCITKEFVLSIENRTNEPKATANSNKFHLTFSPPHVNSRISNFFSKTIQHRMQHLFRDYSND